MLKLVEPKIEDKERALDLIDEFKKYNSEMNGSGGLYRYGDDYEGWIEKINREKNQPVTEEKVPTETYFLVREEDDRIVGMINIRLALNEKLRKMNGNIGYCIRPTERGKGYNNINLYLGLKRCQECGIKEVLLTCDEDNAPSKNTILKFKPRFERQFFDDKVHNCIIQLYWIDVDKGINLWEKENSTTK